MKNTWKVLKGVIGKTNKTIGVEKVKVYFEDHEITEKCNERFVSIGDKLAKEIQTVYTLSPTGHLTPANCKFRFEPISVSQVTKIIKKLLNGKAIGMHGIPNKASKDSIDIIAPSLTDIFNFSVVTKVFPNDMKVGKVAPVNESGEKDDINNCHPI